MKSNEIMVKLRKISTAELQKKIMAWEKELFELKLSAASSHIKDNSQFKKLRQNIARAKTCIEVKANG